MFLCFGSAAINTAGLPDIDVAKITHIIHSHQVLAGALSLQHGNDPSAE
jgi:hypothetical protein